MLTFFIAIYFKDYSLNESIQEIWISKIWLKPNEFNYFFHALKGVAIIKVKMSGLIILQSSLAPLF
jgi:hypothetical protein